MLRWDRGTDFGGLEGICEIEYLSNLVIEQLKTLTPA